MTIVAKDKSKLPQKIGDNYQVKRVKVSSQRTLTAREITLAREVFKDSIDYSKVKIINGGLLGMPNASKNAMTPFGSIHLPSEDYDTTKDFGLDTTDATLKIWFIHEMTHVWQYQHGFNNARAGINTGINGGYTQRSLAYEYSLADISKKFNEYNMEQQAEIVSHYFDATHMYQTTHNSPRLHKQNVMNLPRLRQVLSDFLVNPDNKNLVSLSKGQENYWFK
ncbi:zinc protease [Acinetobacter sp.]|uniref:zinc protease n=1 Tax=Acinetobacter sp. TaxID=472 RepID=UPI0031D1EBAE